MATHATKQGRRYRYYTSKDAVRIRRRGRQGDDGLQAVDDQRLVWRLPAAEVEGVVIRMLVDALSDEHWLAEHVHAPDVSIATRRAASARACDLADQLEAEYRVKRREAVLRLVERVVLDPAAITVTIKIDTIRPAVLGPSAERDLPAPQSRQRTLALTRPFTAHRRGGEVRLVIDGEGLPEPEPDPALLKALAQAHRWWSDPLDRRYTTMRELAAAYDTNERCVAWTLPLAFLPPETVRSTVHGIQPLGFAIPSDVERTGPAHATPPATAR